MKMPHVILAFLLLVFPALPACGQGPRSSTEEARWTAQREAMVSQQLAARGIRDASVLAAMRKVPRHEFLPDDMKIFSYIDSPVPIGHEQTISQPFIVALMTEALILSGTERVLEIGTGSGYQAAVLAEIAPEVYTIEIVEPLGKRARETLERLGCKRVHVKIGDGYRGWPEHAPFDAVIVTAAPEQVPQPLLDQLAMGGRLVVPVGAEGQVQWLKRYTKTPKGMSEKTLEAVQFVPMTGEAQR